MQECKQTKQGNSQTESRYALPYAFNKPTKNLLINNEIYHIKAQDAALHKLSLVGYA